MDNTSTKEGDVIIRRLTSYWQVWIVTKDSSLEPDPNVDPKVEVGREAAEQTARNIAKDTGGRIFLVDQGGALSEISVPRPGDTLVVDKPNGRADVLRLDGSGQWTVVRGGDEDLSNLHTAWEIARTNLGLGCNVWYRLESESDSAIRLYNPN